VPAIVSGSHRSASLRRVFAAMASGNRTRNAARVALDAGAWSTATSMPTNTWRKEGRGLRRGGPRGGLAVFLAETGSFPVLCASGGRTKPPAEANLRRSARVGAVARRCVRAATWRYRGAGRPGLKPDLLIGSSKGYRLAARWASRSCAAVSRYTTASVQQRIRLLGYAGHRSSSTGSSTAVLEAKQETRRSMVTAISD